MHFNDEQEWEDQGGRPGLGWLLDFWEELRRRMESPADFIAAAAGLGDEEMAEIEAATAEARGAGRLVERAGLAEPANLGRAAERLRQMGRPESAADLTLSGRVLIGLALAMSPPDAPCHMSEDVVVALLSAWMINMYVPLYLGNSLYLILTPEYIAGGYHPAELPGLDQLEVGCDREDRPRVPAWLVPARLRELSLIGITVDAPDVTPARLRLCDCDIVAVGAPTERLTVNRCRGDISGLARRAAGIAVYIVGAEYDADPADWPALELGGERYPHLGLMRVAVSGAARAEVLHAFSVRFDGFECGADTALVEYLSGAGRLEADVLRNAAPGDDWAEPAGVGLAAPGAAGANGLWLAAPVMLGLHPAARVAGALAEASYFYGRGQPRGGRPASAARCRTYDGRLPAGCLAPGEPATAVKLADLVAAGEPGVARAATLAGCPAVDLDVLFLTSSARYEPLFGEHARPDGDVSAGLLVVRGGDEVADLTAAIGLWPAGRLAAGAALVVGPDGAEDAAAGERLAAVVGGVRAGRADAAAAGVPALWLARDLRL